MKYPALLFDLDGTLFDSSADLAAAANQARLHFGLTPLSIDAVVAKVGYGLGHLLKGVLPPARHAQLPEAREVFHAYYRAHLLDASVPLPGAEALLDAVADRPLGLVTNKPGAYVTPILRGLGWLDRFQVVIAGDTLPLRKPNPSPLIAGLDALGVAPRDALFIGDTEVDLQTAAAAGVPFVAVAWGRVASEATMTVDDLLKLAHWPKGGL